MRRARDSPTNRKGNNSVRHLHDGCEGCDGCDDEGLEVRIGMDCSTGTLTLTSKHEAVQMVLRCKVMQLRDLAEVVLFSGI